MKKRKALFLDLDGTVRVTNNGKPCPNKPSDQEILPGRVDKIKGYKNKGYSIVAVTNQSGIDLGYMKESDCQDCLEDLNKKMGGVFDLMLYAKSANKEDPCRKPNTGMFTHAAQKMNIDLGKSITVGDMESDRLAGEKAGTKFYWAKDFFGDKNDQINR